MRTANDLEGGHPGASWRTAGGRTLRQARGLSPFPVSPHIARFLRTSQAQGATPRKTSIPTTAKASTHRRLLSCHFRLPCPSAQMAGSLTTTPGTTISRPQGLGCHEHRQNRLVFTLGRHARRPAHPRQNRRFCSGFGVRLVSCPHNPAHLRISQYTFSGFR